MIGNACVVGAGIAGLTAAVALERAGVPTRVFEQSSTLRSCGGALMMWSNALVALREIGLEAEMIAAGSELEAMEFRRADGRLLWTMPVRDTSRRCGAPSLVVPRARAVQVLANALRSPIRFNASYIDHEANAGEGAIVRFSDGSLVTTDLLIGADGARSRTREHVVPNAPSFETGQVAWIGRSNLQHPALRVGLPIGTVGHGLRFWTAAASDGDVYWYAIVQRKHEVASRADLARLYASYHAPIPELIDATSEAELIPVDILDQDPALGWSKPATTLVGDSVHASRPDVGQGACQAIESAVRLVAEITKPQPLAAALESYERARRSRTASVQLLARATAFHSTVENPLLCSLRDIGVATTFPLLAMPALDWLLKAPQA